jgi:phage terminase large subunit-like protein
VAWVDELAKFKYPQETWDNMEFGLRLGERPHVVSTTTPKPIPIIRALMDDPGTRVAAGSTFDNAANLPARFLQRLREKYEGTRLGRQELYAELLSDVPGALWRRDLIDLYRVRTAPFDLKRIVVAIDPAMTATKDSDETGIVVVGIGDRDAHGYVLEDLTVRDTPETWARIAVNAYHRYKADRIIGEVNNGGDLIERVLRTVDGTISYRSVRASRRKTTRAEPVSSLYEQGKVHHVGTFGQLEDQMCTWVPGEPSPDRVDALVWGLTELMLNRRGGGNL